MRWIKILMIGWMYMKSLGMVCPSSIPMLTELEAIEEALSGYSRQSVETLMLHRGEGKAGSMQAKGLHRVLGENTVYELTSHGLQEKREESQEGVLDISLAIQNPQKKIRPPNRTIFRAKWISSSAILETEPESGANILGDNGILYMDIEGSRISVPIETATSETLAYYDAVLLHWGDRVRFPAEEVGYPIWVMDIGLTYVEDYLMKPKGGGWYLEWHKDRPHFHMPLSFEACGFYLLAKALGGDLYEITAFFIPFRSAVFTKRGVLHCDAGLVGENWVVGYSVSEDFSTVLMRNAQHEQVRITPEQNQ